MREPNDLIIHLKPLSNILADHSKWIDASGYDGHQADLGWSDLSSVNLKGAQLSGANLRGANLRGADLREARLIGSFLIGADLSKARLENANLYHADLTDAKLLESNITGIHFAETITFNWKIEGIICDFIFLAYEAINRHPKTGTFTPGEFERLYASYPTIEYIFEQGAEWLDLMSFNYAYAKIKEQNPEFDLKSLIFDDKASLPRALISTPNVEMEKVILIPC